MAPLCTTYGAHPSHAGAAAASGDGSRATCTRSGKVHVLKAIMASEKVLSRNETSLMPVTTSMARSAPLASAGPRLPSRWRS